MSASPERERIARMVERLRAPMVLCPFDPKSPKYLKTDPDKPCEFCGQENTFEGPDLCRGGDLRVMEDAAKLLEAIAQRETGAPVTDIEAIKREAYKQGWNDREGDLLVAMDRIAPPAPQDLAEPIGDALRSRLHDYAMFASTLGPRRALVDVYGNEGIEMAKDIMSAIAPRPAEAQARVEALARQWEEECDRTPYEPGKECNGLRRGLTKCASELRALLSGSPPKPAGVEITEEMVDAGAEALSPKVFSRDPQVAHAAASPNTIESSRRGLRMVAQDVICAALSVYSAGRDAEIHRLRKLLAAANDTAADQARKLSDIITERAR